MLTMIVLVCGCSAPVKNQPDVTTDKAETSDPDSGIDVGVNTEECITTLEELKNKVDSEFGDSNGYYESVLAFITGDTETLARLGQAELDNSAYELIKTVKVSDFEVREDELGQLDFKFTVSESECEEFPVGSHQYKISITWTDESKNYHSEQYSDLISLLEWATGHGCISWENGKATDNFSEYYTFDYGAWRTVMYARTLYSEKGLTLTELDFDYAVNKMFGIKDFNSTSPYLSLVDGEWREPEFYIGSINAVSTIEEIRDMGDGKIEVDIQYFADALRMVPSHKATVYITETDDPVYKYYFEKGVITEYGEYDHYIWSV